jgi:hypothetical protein
MFQNNHSKLVRVLKDGLGMNLCRAEVMAAIVLSAITAKSILVSLIVSRLPGTAKQKSKYRRVQNYFLQTRLDYNAVAVLIVKLLGSLLPDKWMLSLDRTNWTARKKEINLLVLSVCMGDIAVPLFWTDLGYKGNSNTAQRKEIIKRFAATFGYDKIHCLMADREFIGKNWFWWLQKKSIPYVVRLRNNLKVKAGGGREKKVCNLFYNLKTGEELCLDEKKVCGALHVISAIRLPGNELVILVSFGVEKEMVSDYYSVRWNIETGFEKLKSHGFNFEESRLNGAGKYELMLAGLSIALAWCYSIGEWSVRKIEPIKLKKHGRKERSVFGRGLEELRSYFTGCAANLRQLSQVTIGILYRGLQNL